MKKSILNIASKFTGKTFPLHTAIVENGTMYFSDAINIMAVKVNADGNGAIDIADLKKVYSRGEANEFVFTDNNAEIKIGAKSFKLHNYSYAERLIPISKTNACEPFYFEIDQKILNTKKFLGKDELRPAMQGIHFNHVHKQYAATDSHKMYFVDTDFPIGYDLILTAAFFNIPIGRYLVRDFENHVCFSNDDIEFYIGKIDERYPDYKGVIPQSFNTQFVFDKSELKELIQDALICANPTTNMIVLNDLGLIRSYDVELNKEFEAKAASFTKTHEFESPIGINGKYLLELIDIQEDKQIRIDIVSSNRAFIINGNCLLTPVMVK